jgi:hypothetical protein
MPAKETIMRMRHWLAVVLGLLVVGTFVAYASRTAGSCSPRPPVTARGGFAARSPSLKPAARRTVRQAFSSPTALDTGATERNR